MKNSFASAALIFGAVLFTLTTQGSQGAHGAEVNFEAKPTVTKKGPGWEIRFSVSQASDVEVAILDAKGRTVRHLAAGLLGDNPPPPLKKGLVQAITWDGQDDLGKPAPTGCRVRVRLGNKASFGKVLFYQPGISFSPRAVSVGPDKLLYVLMELGQTKSTFLLQAFSKDGKYVKTVMPYPANLEAGRLTGLPRVKLADGRMLPMIQLANFRDLYPISTGMRPQTMPITSQGSIVLVNASKTHNAGTRPHHLLLVSTDGGIPDGLKYIGPPASAEKLSHGYCWTALSPDEKWIYTSGHLKGNGNDDGFRTPPHNVVYRIGWKDTELAKPFIGELHKAGSDQTHFKGSRGVATDAKGNIYVCDHGNNRVAIFTPEGKWLDKIDVEAPDQIAVNRAKGTVYVLTNKRIDRKKSELKLVKFPGIGKPATATVNVGMPYCTIGLDTQDQQPVIWLARTFGERANARRGVEKIVDQGSTLTTPVEVIKHRRLPDVFQIAASPVNNDVFVHSYSEHQFARVDGITDQVKLLKLKGHDVACGPDGNVYINRSTSWKPGTKTIEKYDRQGQPVKFSGLDSHGIKKIPGNISGHATSASKGFSISLRGDIVTIDKSGLRWGVSIYGTDGNLKSKKLIDGMIKAGGSPVMDLAGNVYIASAAKPPEQQHPAVFGKKAPNAYYNWMYGSVVKFPPQGGKLYYPPPRYRKKPEGMVWPPPDPDKLMLVSKFMAKKAYIEGALWIRPEFAALPGGRLCGCYTARFTVDGFGRVYIPDPGRCSVLVVDTANNEIMRFGDYANEDSAGPGSRIPEPTIPLAWPHAVTVGMNGLYVGDVINRRIIRVDLKPTAEAGCELK
jgi:NHL repeat